MQFKSGILCPFGFLPSPRSIKRQLTWLLFSRCSQMQVAKSRVGVMRTDSVFLLFPGFWVFATRERGREPEQNGAGETLIHATETHNYNWLKARMLGLKEYTQCIDNSGIFWQNHHRIRSQAEMKEKLRHLEFLLLHFTTYLQEINLCIWLFWFRYINPFRNKNDTLCELRLSFWSHFLQQICTGKGKLKDYDTAGLGGWAAYHMAVKPQGRSSVAEQHPCQS